ncbi:hypothetical protein EI546_05770 [Aequorivita sp. H23M31]|uniref:Uncharacterized protein n=1 Tax=Aequorivita ciconiae TaxID=2494375 RepID=A0A410G1X3_9FLAO|nr:DUF11 domain-containing protein [Aequorivita sp. H23M31]QAA81264.1 hypothetical protein EI546_05770 [Aequorivita sp. H23M31]
MKTTLNIKILKFLPSLLLLCISLFSVSAWADGSKDLYPLGKTGLRGHLRANTGTNEYWPFANNGIHYVYAEVGEILTLASSAQRSSGNQRIRLYAPDGTMLIDDLSGGNIPNRAAELAGPLLFNEPAGGNKYLPIYHPVSIPGIYRIEFLARGTSNPTNQYDANANWVQPNTAAIMAWDISVINSTNTGFIQGRVYTNVLNLSNGNQDVVNKGFDGIVYVLTKDGYTYRVNNNGNNGIWFTFYVNNNGFVNGSTQEPLYKSLNKSQNFGNQAHNPNSADTQRHITHKMFYTLPSTDLPTMASGAVPGGNTWLKNEVIEPDVSGVEIYGVDGTLGQVGNKGGYIKFLAGAQGQYKITIESNESPARFETRILSGSSSAGQNSVLWDGKDGNGNPLPIGDAPSRVTVQLQGAEVHFPFIDMEYNKNGTIVELLDHVELTNNGNQLPISDIVYWDDSDITYGNNGSIPNPINNSHLAGSSGISSNSNGHIWGIGGTGTSGQFGDAKAIDTWTFIKGQEETVETTVVVKIADLEIPSITPNISNLTAIGTDVTFVIKVKNNGPSDVEAAPFSFIVPEGFDPSTFSFNAINGCGSENTSLTFNPVTRTYSSTLNLPNGCEAEYDVTMTVNSDITVNDYEFTATIMRPNDVTDPDATNPDPEIPPTDPFFECENNGLGGVCNNIKTISLPYSQVIALQKQGVFNDENGDGISQPGETITYTLTVINTGVIDIYDVVLQDPMLGGVIAAAPSGDTNSDGILNIGETWIYTVQYNVTQNDINNKGVFNLASVSGKNELNYDLLPVTSLDPNPLDPNNINYDPSRPDHTFVPLISELICTEAVDGQAFKWSYANSPDPTISETMIQPGANGGFQLDIFELDNSFNMNINGILLASQEIEFQASTGLIQNIRFKDGTIWEQGGIQDIWRLRGAPGKPIVRVIIAPNGKVSMYGSKRSHTSSNYFLEPLELFRGNSFNTINWNPASTNTIIVTQNVVGKTLMDGYGTGRNIIPCETYTLEKDGIFNDQNNDGIAQPGETITYTLTVTNLGDIDIYDLQVNDPMLGGIINATPSGDTNGDGILNTYEVWTYSVEYPVTQTDIDNKGVFNLATVSGNNVLEETLDPETSVDPTPLDPNDPMYDPSRPEHTFVPLKGRSLLITNPNIYQRVKSN